MNSNSRSTIERLARAKRAFTTRRVPTGAMADVIDGDAPSAGDLVLARVTELGQHERIERPDGRRARLFPGDEIIVAYGNRYAPDQFEAEVPANLEPCHLVAAGGVAASVLAAHENMDAPTAIEPIGFVADEHGQRINLARFGLPDVPLTGRRPFTVAVAGTAMNSGKTTTAAHIVLGLTRGGWKVAAAKVTGTGAGGDMWLLGDAGAAPVLDFTDAGVATTYRLDPAATERVFTTLIGHLGRTGVDAVVVEVADGIYQEETAHLLTSSTFAGAVDAVIFAAGDAVAAGAGIRWLRAHELPVLAVSGRLTASPLSVREARATGLPVAGRDELADPRVVTGLLDGGRLAQSA